MKAVVLEKLNSPLVIAEVEPTPLQFGQVLVKNLVSGLCGAQLHEIKGHKGNANFLPHLLGHEGCGIVQDVGDACVPATNCSNADTAESYLWTIEQLVTGNGFFVISTQTNAEASQITTATDDFAATVQCFYK